MLDPVGRYLRRDYVASDVLVVDGVPLAGEDPRVEDAAEALAEPSPEERAAALARIGVGAVVTDPTAPGGAPPAVAGRSLLDSPDLRVVALDGVREREVQTTWQVATAAGWVAFLAPFALAAGVAVRRRREREPQPFAPE